MALKFTGGKATETGSFPIRLRSTLLDNNVAIWEGPQAALQEFGRKLQARGLKFEVRPGFGGRYELTVDAGSAMRYALKGIGLPIA